MKYFEMFSGIGGFRYGIEEATRACGKRKNSGLRITNNKQSRCSEISQPNEPKVSRNYTCIGYSEIDKYATAIYQYHYPETRNYGDATTINVSELPDFDLLIAGFPCQSFSIAGKRKGFNDTRGTLFFEIARILKYKRPRYFLLENVWHLVGHDNGKTFHTILGVLSDIGYEYQWQVLNSKDFGVPQNRERVFIIGNIRGEPRPEVFPIGEIGCKDNELQGQQIITNTIKARHEADANGSYIVERKQFSQAVDISMIRIEGKPRVSDNVFKTLNTVQCGGHLPMVVEKRTDEGLRTFKDNICGTLRGMDSGGDKLIVQSKESFIGNCSSIRRLTPIECEQLQAFPDGFTKYGIMNGKKVEISDTQRYKVLGNAVTTTVITAIMEKLLWKK